MIERHLDNREFRRLSQQSRALALGGIILGVVVIVAIVLWFTHSVQKPSSADVDFEKSASTVGTFRPTQEQWKSFTFAAARPMLFQTELVTDGLISNNEDTTTQVFSPYSGRVSKLIARLGDFVKKGAPLMTIETSDFTQARNNLITALAAVDGARNRLQNAQQAEQYQHELYLHQKGSLKEWQQSQAQIAGAQNAFDTAQSVVTGARNQISLLGNSDAEIDAIEHDPAMQHINPGAYVLAPISGTVTQRQVGLGQYVTTVSSGASTPVYTINNLSTVWLIGNVRETDVPKLRLGEPVEVTVTAYPEKVFHAKITWIAAAVDPATHRLQVRAEVANPDRILKPMMFATFRIRVGKQLASIGVPQSAVVYEGSIAHVWVANNDGTIVSRQVFVGRTSNGMVEISSGLKMGETIVTSGTLFIDRAAENDNS